MAKQSSQVRNEIQNEGRRINTDSDNLSKLLYGGLDQARGRDTRAYDDAYGGYSQVLDRARSGSGANFGRNEAEMRAFAQDPLRGVDQNRFRGNGVFDEFSRTGGVSDDDRALIRERTNRTLPSYYDAIRDKMSHQAAISGGSPSYSSSLSRIARDQSRATSDALTDAEFDIMDRRNSGRRWGAEGASRSEGDLANLRSSNTRFGLGGALDAARAGADDSFRNNSLAMDASRGIQSLRGQIPAELFGLYDFILNNQGQRGGLAGNNISQRASYDPNVSWFDRIMKIWGQASDNARTAASAGAI